MKNIVKNVDISGLLLLGSISGAAYATWGVLNGIPVSYWTAWAWIIFLEGAATYDWIKNPNENTGLYRLRLAACMLVGVIVSMRIDNPVQSIAWLILVWRICDVGLMYHHWKVNKNVH